MPAAAVIPARVVNAKIAAVKTLVVGGVVFFKEGLFSLRVDSRDVGSTLAFRDEIGVEPDFISPLLL